MQTPTVAATPPGRTLRISIGWNRYKKSGIIAALLLLIIGIPLVFLKVQSTYTAEAIFQVAPAYQKTLSADRDLELQSNSQYREFVNHLTRSLLRYDILEHALDALIAKKIDPKLPSQTKRQWIENAQKTVFILAIPDTYMVRVGINSTEKKNLDNIVNAIMDSFLETTRKEQIYGADSRERTLSKKTTILNTEITQYESRRADLATFLGLTTFGESSTNPFDVTLALAREKLVVASIERSHAEATLAAFEHEREVPSTAGRSLMEMRLQDNGLQSLRNEVIKRNEELYRVSAGLEEDHPAKIPAIDEQKELNNRLRKKETDFGKETMANTRARFRATQQETIQVEKELETRVRQLEGQARQFASTFREAVRFTGEIKKRELELSDIRVRDNYLQIESNALGFARLITPALPAVTPQGVGKIKILMGLVLASMALTLLVPMAFDYFDKRVITMGDAEKVMGISSAAWFVNVDDVATGALRHDQFRRFAATLIRNQERGIRNVFSFTSVHIGGGSTSIILELARTFIELGISTLVIDADSMNDGSVLSSNLPGITDLMAGKAGVSDVVNLQNHLGSNVSVVPYGLSQDTGIKSFDIFKSALEFWKSQFKIVLIDIPPLLASADAELLIGAIDQVFLVVEAEVQKKSDVARSKHQLKRMDPDAVGLIVNRLEFDRRGTPIKSHI